MLIMFVVGGLRGNQSESSITPVLQGLSIHVNGYTDPPQSELRRLIVQYGGDYQHYCKNPHYNSYLTVFTQ